MAAILVLDDVEDASVLVGKILKRKGHAVHSSTDEEEALNHARSKLIDLAILDIKLRKMSGIEVLAQLKRIHPGIKTIMLTGYPTQESVNAASGLGADAYCVKPIDLAELEEKVARILTPEAGT